ncbi:STAS/SEC14 domain-containing protein [Streptomyces sp. MOE7]|uniref:STAS/SEC14 domain-containing protein n=1 Tax=Streptomyces sp. MOE7 TaxID=1961713 RepID=UPI0009FED26C
MLERAEDAPAGIDAVKATGTVSKHDYETVVEPLIDAARKEGRRIKLLYEIGPDFRSFTPGAGWEDLKVGLGAMRLFEGCALVTDVGWIRESTRMMSFLMPCPVRVYGNEERAEALHWLASLPEGPGISHRARPRLGAPQRRRAAPPVDPSARPGAARPTRSPATHAPARRHRPHIRRPAVR